MSEEQPPPPPLRLKPRLRPAEPGTPSTASGPAPLPAEGLATPPAEQNLAPTGGVPAPDAPRIRLRPRLVGGSAAAATTPEPDSAPAEPPVPAKSPVLQPSDAPASVLPDTIPAIPPPIRLASRIGLEPAPRSSPPVPSEAEAGAADPEAPRFKLKPKSVAPSAPSGVVPIPPPSPILAPGSAPGAMPAPPTPPATPPLLPPPGMATIPPTVPPMGPAPAAAKPVAPQATAGGPPPPFPPPGKRVPPSVAPPSPLKLSVPPPAALPPPPESGKGLGDETAPKAKRGRTVLLAGLAAVVLAGAAYFGWETWMSEPPPPPPKAKAAPKAAPAAAPAAPTATAGPASGPIGAAVQARDAAGAARSDLSIGLDDTAHRPAVPDPAAGAATPSTGVVALSPGLSATRSVDAAAEASAAFRSFVANAKISGVVGPRPGRGAVALINGRLARSGDVIDQGLGITFENVDVEKKQVIFKDRSGATVARRY